MIYNVNNIYNILSKIFNGIDLENKNEKGYVIVHCPFHQDNKTSAALNPIDGFFKCFTCGTEYQFEQLIKEYFKIGDDKKLKIVLKNLVENLDETNEVDRKHLLLMNNIGKLFRLQAMGITTEVIQQCKLIDNNNAYELCVPITIDNMLLGYKYYTSNPGENSPKTFVTTGTPNGLIIPFDLWRTDTRPTLICEGEKDMLIARSNGFNAITFTGGCNALPLGWEKWFVNKTVAITYDNDVAGRDGATKLADHLYKNGCKEIRVVVSYYDVIKGDKEDVADFFMKYNKDKLALATYINNTPLWTVENSKQIKLKETPLLSLDKCLHSENINKKRQSIIQIRAESGVPKSISKFITFNWGTLEGEKGPEIKYEITKDNMEVIIGLIQEPTKVTSYLKKLSSTAAYNNRPYVAVKGYKYLGANLSDEQITLYTCLISPFIESEIVSHQMGEVSINESLELVAYSFERLETSKVYTITHKAVPSEFDKRNIVICVLEAEKADSSISNFVVDDNTKQILDCFKATNVKEKVEELYNKIKYNGIAHLNYDLWLANDLTFHSCLWFKLNNKMRRGTIYTNIIGDTRVGKSEISQALVQLYKQGKFVNAKLATIDSIIGGSVTKGNEQFIKAGVLPKNNRGLIVLEELHGLGNDYFKKVTEVKSSGKVSLQRVSGELSLECNLRLVEISNPKASDDKVGGKSVSEFPDGIRIIQSLISNPEDIARNDIYVVIKKTATINPYASNEKVEAFPDNYYQERIKWAWSRKPTNIIFENEKYIWDKADKELNPIFDCDGLSLLGNEAYIKVAKMAISLAIMLSSTLDYENVFVKNEHVDFIVDWLKQLYSNDVMKVDKHVENEKLYAIYTDDDIENLQDIYRDWSSAVDYLEVTNEVPQSTLIQVSGKSQNQTAPLFTKLTCGRFIKMQGTVVVPTIKFRKAIKFINKTSVVVSSQVMEGF